jgi:hypothetical protein
MIASIEETLKPILQYASRPQLIDFDDDLIFILDALIKKWGHC